MNEESLWFRPPPPPSRLPSRSAPPETSIARLVIDGRPVAVPDTWTILRACQSLGIDVPTLCYSENLTPANVCRICVVELAGARSLVPACSRKVEPGMEIRTDSPRVRLSRKMVMEFLASSVDLSASPRAQAYAARYGAQPQRYGLSRPLSQTEDRDRREPGHHHPSDGSTAETVAQPVKVDNSLYVRDYGKCILCYKCVAACGTDAQNTFAIAVAGRGFDARISTESNIPLPESACVYCGNCIGVCPTGALMFRSEFELRRQSKWDESQQTQTDTICPYCGVGCTLTLHVQDNRIVKVTSPVDVEVTRGHLCIKGRFGFEYVQGSATQVEAAPKSNEAAPQTHEM